LAAEERKGKLRGGERGPEKETIRPFVAFFSDRTGERAHTCIK